MLIDAREMKTSMRKNLGNKRYAISEEHIKEILRLYSEFKEGGFVKIFPTSQFGYRKITVERPLQRSFEVTGERLERLKTEKVFAKLSESDAKDPAQAAKEIEEGKARQEAVLALLRSLPKGKVLHPAKFLTLVEKAADAKDVVLSKPLKKAIVNALGMHDEEAEIVRDAKGTMEADPELRDHEYVPLSEDIHECFRREVAPYVSNTWIDEGLKDEKDGQVGKVGYEINFTRYFYKYAPPRALEVIDGEIVALEKEIQDALEELAA